MGVHHKTDPPTHKPTASLLFIPELMDSELSVTLITHHWAKGNKKRGIKVGFGMFQHLWTQFFTWHLL